MLNSKIKIAAPVVTALMVMSFTVESTHAMTVTNELKENISIGLSTHGSGGNTNDFSIAPNKSENWSRSAERGNLLNFMNKQYYVKADETIIVRNWDLLRKDNLLTKATPANSDRFYKDSDGSYSNIFNYLEKYNLKGSDVYIPSITNTIQFISVFEKHNVSLSRWDNGTGSYSDVSKGSIESWSRSGSKGNILTITHPLVSTLSYQYFVYPGETIQVLNLAKGEVFISGLRVNQITTN